MVAEHQERGSTGGSNMGEESIQPVKDNIEAQNGGTLIVTMIYAKCSALERIELWNNLEDLSSEMKQPWLIDGDFNVVLNEEEKIGGLLVYPPEYEEFAHCINSCDISDINFK
ncbi:hypothetical protein HAX54_048511 [Datura stramonium]|uniref:Uncharacterized protein n=1 Tax=Datura stramonium TaxID=4076 RepID=A0ABS8WM60_DATST|nr:hypothetical protein [Datura stramonium]